MKIGLIMENYQAAKNALVYEELSNVAKAKEWCLTQC